MIRILSLALLLAFLPSCSISSEIDQGESLKHLPLVERVVGRLAGYEGPSSDGIAFLAAFAVRKVDLARVRPIAIPVLDRYDAAVEADAGLDPGTREVYSLTSENLRRTINFVGGG